MPMVKKLTKTGTSYAIIIDKSIMQLLSISPDSLIEIETDGKSLIMTPVQSKTKVGGIDDPKFQKSTQKILEQYSEAFEELAK